ncbi:unnamed protein product [Periconia digitata]|uniref:Uncharacterized protein n=1 Tax=Periconia digitata TaxID=1303443 RepID=A0A9W4U637_9PLEO|nr:unnamed protein product [Periconia digitata]
MARTNSTYSASPQRWRSPRRSPERQPSEDGSQYEMDLDALGLNSTFESTELDESQRPKIDVVETSDIDGPEDFTMNMTYWMTAELPITRQVKSRKEAKFNIVEVRGDATQESEGSKTVDDQEKAQDQTADTNPPAQATIVSHERPGSKDASDESMEHEEKVRSYLSALPDAGVGERPLPVTPRPVPKQSMLQVPSPSVAKTRSLQPTVEDYDTPRKPTQETVIHHPPQRIVEEERDDLRQKVQELQAQLEQQQLVSKTRITELETLLSYTRSDLETARNDTYTHKTQIQSLRSEQERLQREAEDMRGKLEDRVKKQEEEMASRMKEYKEELRLQHLAKSQDQRDEFEQQLQAVENAKRAADEKGEERERLLIRMKTELSQLRSSHEEELEDMRSTFPEEHHMTHHEIPPAQHDMQKQLSTLQSRAQTLQAELERATSEAQSARHEAEKSAALETSTRTENQTLQSRVEDLHSREDSLQKQLLGAQTELEAQNRRLQDSSENEERLDSLQKRLEDSRAEIAAKDKQVLRMRELESQVDALRAQLDAVRNDAGTKDHQMLQRMEEHEHFEERLNTAHGRTQSLEATVATLRQQIAEARQKSAKTQADAEQFEQDLEDAGERLQDARVEADRRVADVERRLAKTKDAKNDLESRFNDLKSQHEELVEDYKFQMEQVRDKAEDAVRKAGHLLEQERSEKKRIAKDLKRATHDIEQLRAENAKNSTDLEFSDEESSILSSSHDDAKDTEIEHLRLLLRKQSSTLKSFRSETTSLRKETIRLKTEIHQLSSTSTAGAEDRLHASISALRRENEKLTNELRLREEDFEAVNKAMDERLAAMVSKVLKQKAKSVVGKRDEQWAGSVSQAVGERDLLGRALMREWGRQEVGVADEDEGQGYKYKYVRRS